MKLRKIGFLALTISLGTFGAAGCGKVKDNGDNVTPDGTVAWDGATDHDAAVDPMCEDVEIGAQSFAYKTYFAFEIPEAEASGRMEFYNAVAGTFDLAAGVDANYSTCVNCFVIVTSSGADTPTTWFQSGGTLTLNQAPGPSSLSGSVTNLTLAEVTIGMGSVSTLVVGGTCLNLGSFDLSVMPLL